MEKIKEQTEEDVLALVTVPDCRIREMPGNQAENNSEITDEIFSGWAVAILPEEEKTAGWVLIETHYGYTGYVMEREVRPIGREELMARQDTGRFKRTVFFLTDVLDRAKVQGLPLEQLPKNSFVELLEELEDGWSRIRTASGTEGYLRTADLAVRKDNDLYLIAGQKKTWFTDQWSKMREQVDEETFREQIVKNAMAYLGAQYRWGGKSALGIDCSGLVFMSCMESGVLLYRDADLKERYPAHLVSKENLKKGDTLFFPGHVGLCIGGLRFIHATAYAPTPCVTISSLDPGDPLYRKDLDEKLEKCGTIF